MPEDVAFFDVIYTQRAIRKFKPDPVPDELIRKVIEASSKAPSGGNRQTWAFVVIRDPETRRKIGDHYRDVWLPRYAGTAEGQGRGVLQGDVYTWSRYLAEHMGDAPVLILACLQHDEQAAQVASSEQQVLYAGRYASIYPAVQNLMLAARALGLGTVITTVHLYCEKKIKELLGIPESVETCALIPMGYPADDLGFGPTRRLPVAEVTHWERWGAKG